MPGRSAMAYIPPTPDDLRRLKDSLQFTGEQMADLFGLGGGHQWRKYTGGDAPRAMSQQMLFYAAAQLELSQADVDRIRARMRAIGANDDGRT